VRKYSENDFKASVGKYGADGKQCYNTVADQQMVQDLLNRIREYDGGTYGKLTSAPRWGVISDELHQAILRFQKAHATDEGLAVDGHVDPHERTIRALLKYAYRILRFDPPDGMYFPAKHADPIDTGPEIKVGGEGLNRTSWRLVGSGSLGGSVLVLAAGGGHFTLRRAGVSFPYTINYTLAGASVSKLPASVAVGPESFPQHGTPIWSFLKKDLDFQDLIGPLLVLQGSAAVMPGGYTGCAVWFNAALGVGLPARAIGALPWDQLAGRFRRLNKSAGGVAFLRGPQLGSTDLSASLLTGIGWPGRA
jgi:hypothetical protein